MSAAHVSSITPARRDALFAEIARIVKDVGLADAAMERLGETGFAVDEALEEICDLLHAETARARRKSRRAKAVAV